MNARYSLVLLAALVCPLVTSGDAQAQYGLHGGCGGYGHGYGYDVGRLYGVLAQNVPYYAAFPPVYYSAPVPRTYGYSPFAYPPGTVTPDIAPMVAAKEILNPYVSLPSDLEEPLVDKVTQADVVEIPLAMSNPYVTQPLVRSASLQR